jgi:hypothetical protein
MLNNEDAFPEGVNSPTPVAKSLRRLFEASDASPRNTKDREKFVPKRLSFCAFALFALPFAREGYRSVSDFVPR